METVLGASVAGAIIGLFLQHGFVLYIPLFWLQIAGWHSYKCLKKWRDEDWYFEHQIRDRQELWDLVLETRITTQPQIDCDLIREIQAPETEESKR